jgi:hypothetical protein
MRKCQYIRKSSIAVAVSTVFLLSACAGGGGGGTPNPTIYLRTEVPYSTPTRVGTVDPLVNTKHTAFVGDTYVASISGTGEDVIIAGGKGASLGEMINAGIPVPNGFVIISNTNQNFILANNLKNKIKCKTQL